MSNKTMDKHHIISRATCKKLGIDPGFEGNVIKVKTGKHRAWHQLFGSITPDEAIQVMLDEWSLSEAGKAEFKRLTNVRLFRRKQK